MSIYEEIKKIRQDLKLTTTDFAKKLGVSQSYITILEKYPQTGGKIAVPSTELIERIVSLIPVSEKEREVIKRKLFIERAKHINPELKDFFTEKEKYYTMEAGMSLVFIERLKNDLKNFPLLDDIYNKTKMSKEEMDLILEGKMSINRQSVISLALALQQPVEDYILLADYMPENIKNLMSFYKNENKRIAFFRKLTSLSEKDIDKMIDVFENIINMVLKEGEKDNDDSKGV